MHASLTSAFQASVARHPEKAALFWGPEQITYRQIGRQADWVAHRLRADFAIQPGDRVGLWMRNRPEFVPALLGALAAGAVAVPINNFLKPAELAYQVADAGIRVLIADAELAEGLATTGLSEVPVMAAGEIPGDPAATAGFPPVPRVPSDLAVLIYTSGTTGHPKGAMLTHGNLLHNVESCRKILQVVDVDRFVLMLPMFHSFMLTVSLLLPLITGGAIVLIRSVTPPKAMLEEMLMNRGSVLPAMAQIFRMLAALPAGLELPLRLCISGAGPLPGEILRAFNQRHPKTPLIEGYGLSEASPVVAVNPVQGPWIAGTIGVPIPDVEVGIRDAMGNPVADGVDGELWVRGGNVMAGYWNAPEKTADTLVDGWLRTGDIGHRRPDGYFVITDRLKDMLKPNGINVYPREIEEVIYTFPGVRECAVVGEPDERRGERPIAFLALDEGQDFNEKALLAFLKEQLADYKVPRRAIVLPSLPRNATGKLLKTRLRELVQAGV